MWRDRSSGWPFRNWNETETPRASRCRSWGHRGRSSARRSGAQTKGAIEAYAGEDFCAQARLCKRGKSDKFPCQTCGRAQGARRRIFGSFSARCDRGNVVAQKHFGMARINKGEGDSVPMNGGLVNRPAQDPENDIQACRGQCADGQGEDAQSDPVEVAMTGFLFVDGPGSGAGIAKASGRAYALPRRPLGVDANGAVEMRRWPWRR